MPTVHASAANADPRVSGWLALPGLALAIGGAWLVPRGGSWYSSRAAQATPMTFVSPRTGRQYVVVMAGGQGSLGTRLGDSLLAFAFPEEAAGH